MLNPSSPFTLSVVWNYEWESSVGTLHIPAFRDKSLSDPNWSGEIRWYQVSINPGYNCQPVVTKKKVAGQQRVYVICRSVRGLELLERVFEYGQYKLKAVDEDALPGTTGSSSNPTLVSKPEDMQDGQIHFAWQQPVGGENRIYYSSYDGATLNTPETVTLTSAGIEINQQPSIAYDSDDKINIAWSGFDVDLNAYVLLHRQKAGEEWEALNEIYYSYSNLSHPSIGSFADAPYQGWLEIALKFGDDHFRIISYDKNKWNWRPEWIEGSHPSLSDQGAELMLTGTDNAPEAPYRIIHQLLLPAEQSPKNLTVSNRGENNPPVLKQKHFRKELFQFSNLPISGLRGKVQVSLGDLHIQTADSVIAWRFSPLPDSTLKNIFMQTEALTVSGDMQTLMLRYRARVTELKKPARFPNLPLFRLRLLDESAGQPLMVVKQVSLNDLSGSQFNEEDSLAIDLQPFLGQKIVLQMQTVHHILSGKNQKPDRVNRYEFYETASPLAKQSFGNQQEVSLAIPAEFALSQNYPNPFNPETTISFALPKSSDVKLEIFDISGRRIKTLINDALSSGFYEVEWDGKNQRGIAVTSGVYVYRLKAGDFVKSRKLMLIR